MQTTCFFSNYNWKKLNDILSDENLKHKFIRIASNKCLRLWCSTHATWPEITFNIENIRRWDDTRLYASSEMQRTRCFSTKKSPSSKQTNLKNTISSMKLLCDLTNKEALFTLHFARKSHLSRPTCIFWNLCRYSGYTILLTLRNCFCWFRVYLSMQLRSELAQASLAVVPSRVLHFAESTEKVSQF